MERQDTPRTAKKIHEYLSRGKYAKVISMTQNLNYMKVNNSMMLLDITTAYEELDQKDTAKEVLLSYVNSHATFSRSLLQKTIALCLETGDLQNAKVMCMKFGQMWPEDPSSLLMRCEIVSAAGGSYAEQIAYLERYTEQNFEEKWGFRLAELYYRNGQAEECAKTCHKLIMYFGEGEYVEKAARVKQDLGGLTQEEILILSKAYPQTAARFTQESDHLPEQEPQATTEGPSRYAGYGEDSEENETEYDDSDFSEDPYGYGGGQRDDGYEQSVLEAKYQQDLQQAQAAIPPIYAENDEELAEKRARYSVDSKLRQTEELARANKERTEWENRTRQEMITRTLHNDHYQAVEQHRVPSSMDRHREPLIFTGKDREASVNHILSQFHRRLREESDEDDDIYINIGVNSERYAEEIENNLRDELTMLTEEQVRSLTGAQVKEIHELMMLKDVRSMISALIKASLKDLPERDTAEFISDLSTFEEMDPYRNLADELNEQENAKKEAEARAEAKARAEALKKTQEESKRIAQERALAAEEARRQENEEWMAAAEMLQNAANTEEVPEANAASGDVYVDDDGYVYEDEVDGDGYVYEDEVDGDGYVYVDDDGYIYEDEADGDGYVYEDEADGDGYVYEDEADGDGYVYEDEAAAGGLANAVTADAGGFVNEVEPDSEKDIFDVDMDISDDIFASTDTSSDAEEAQNDSDADIEAEKSEEPNQKKLKNIFKKKTEKPVEKKVEKKAEKPVQNVTMDISEVAVAHTVLDDIHDPEEDLSSDLFMDCIVALAEKEGYTVDENAFMTIAVLSDQMKEQETALSLKNAKIMTNHAVQKAQKRSFADKLLDRANKDNITTLRDKHFTWNASMASEEV